MFVLKDLNLLILSHLDEEAGTGYLVLPVVHSLFFLGDI